MITEPEHPGALANWDLDSDRGYACKQWDGTLPSDNLNDETYNIEQP